MPDWGTGFGPEMVPGVPTVGITSTMIELELAVAGEGQEAVLVITRLTDWPLVSVVVLKVEAVAPDTALPFTIH
jgi:hypothetical protein